MDYTYLITDYGIYFYLFLMVIELIGAILKSIKAKYDRKSRSNKH